MKVVLYFHGKGGTTAEAILYRKIVDLEKIIKNMMISSGVTEDELKEKKEISTNFGEVLSWNYLCYVKSNPISWKIPTDILFGENDNFTFFETISEFARKNNSTLTVMKNGKHWFHTEEQMNVLDSWMKKCLGNY